MSRFESLKYLNVLRAVPVKLTFFGSNGNLLKFW